MSAPPTQLCHDTDLVGLDNGHALVSAVQTRAYALQIPLNVTLELTQRCNIRCLHCYNFDRDEPKRPRSATTTATTPARTLTTADGCAEEQPDLSLDEVLRLLDDLRAAGCLFLTLTGGEIFAYRDLFAVLDRARELHFAVQLLTNGTLLRPGVAARLAGYRNLLGMSVSLYGATPAVHDGITQVVGSWRRTCDGIERLRALGIAVRLKFIVMRQNAHEVAAMRAAAEAGGYGYMVDVTITARHDGTNGSLTTRVDDEQLATLYRGALHDLVPRAPRVVTEETFPCNCARGNCAISARGEVTPCISVPWVAGNVRERPFIDIWRSAPVFQRIRGLQMADYAACAPCPDKAFCSRERGAAFTASGSYTGIDPFVCKTAGLVREVATEAAAPRTVETAVTIGTARPAAALRR